MLEGDETPSDWIAARQVLDLVSERNGSETAIGSIARRAYAGLVRTRAALFIREQQGARGAKERVEETDIELPPAFWWAKGEAALEQNWRAGDFSTWIDQKFEWQAFGVQFERSGIAAMLAPPAATTAAALGATEETAQAAQAAQFTPPLDEAIVAKMIELTERGWTRDAAAKAIAQEPGFELVGVEHARRVASGNLRRGRPKKSAG